MSSDSDVINKDNVCWLFLQLRKAVASPISLGLNLSYTPVTHHVTGTCGVAIVEVQSELLRSIRDCLDNLRR